MAPKPQQYSAEELENLRGLLTEEELDGMLDEDLIDDPEDGDDDNDSPFADEPDDKAGADDAATGDDDDDDDDDAGDDAGDDDDDNANGDDDAADKAAADPDDAAKPGADAGKVDPAAGGDDADDLPDIDLPEPPKFEAREAPKELVEATGAKKVELEKQIEDLTESFDEGDITAGEYATSLRKLSGQIERLDIEVEKASVTPETAEAMAKEHWGTKTVPAFLEHFPEYKGSRRMLSLLDQVVRDVQVDEATTNPLHPDVLRKAHRIIEREFGLKFAKSAKAATTAADDPKPAANGKRVAPGKDKPREIPPTLGRVPAAENADTADTSRWGVIDRLKGVEYEEALARLSEEESDAYEAWLAAKG